jgi:hypothetical protein
MLHSLQIQNITAGRASHPQASVVALSLLCLWRRNSIHTGMCSTYVSMYCTKSFMMRLGKSARSAALHLGSQKDGRGVGNTSPLPYTIISDWFAPTSRVTPRGGCAFGFRCALHCTWCKPSSHPPAQLKRRRPRRPREANSGELDTAEEHTKRALCDRGVSGAHWTRTLKGCVCVCVCVCVSCV